MQARLTIIECIEIIYLLCLIKCRGGISGVASSMSGGDIFIYSCSAQLISFEIESIIVVVFLFCIGGSYLVTSRGGPEACPLEKF